MEGNGGQVRPEGTTISSTASDDVDMMDGQDQETVAGSGTHLGGLVAFGKLPTEPTEDKSTSVTPTEVVYYESMNRKLI
jgi:hypothetical protein